MISVWKTTMNGIDDAILWAGQGAYPGPDNAYLADFAGLLLRAYERAFNEPLSGAPDSASDADVAAWLFLDAPFALLAHNGGADPTFIYANRTALRLFERSWQGMVGLPSRLSAAPDDRAERQRMLSAALAAGGCRDYAGVRQSSTGRRFQIRETAIWTIGPGPVAQMGQAALIPEWSWLD